MNREFIIRHNRPTDWQQLEDGTVVLQSRDVDLVTSRNTARLTFISPSGEREKAVNHFRFDSLTELVRMLATAGLSFPEVWGDFDCSPYTLDSPRMIVLASKE